MQRVKLRTLMWIDCLAAFSSAITNAVFYKTFAAIFQLPPDLLLTLMGISFVYGFYSLSLALKFYVKIPMVRFVVVANFIYAGFCAALAIYFSQKANWLGIAYLSGESFVVALLAFIELKSSKYCSTMNDFKTYLESFKIFTTDEIEEASKLYTVRKVDKNYFFIREGKISEEVGFIKSGIFRSFYTGDDGNETTYCFRFPNEMITAYSSFITGKPSVESMQAITPAELLVIQKKDVEKLSENVNWIKFSKLMAEYEFIELENRLFQFQRNSAAERYQYLLKHQPDYIKNIPLQYLASYLGISQRHLSRIRKEIF